MIWFSAKYAAHKLHTNFIFAHKLTILHINFIFWARVARADINKNSPCWVAEEKKAYICGEKMMLFIDDKEAPAK